jgi:putative tricarboxylic transport membrane protein
MDLLTGHAFSIQNLISLLIGSFCGIIGGAMPGLSTAGTLALLLPFTMNMEPLPAIAILVAAYTGAQYGGSITATLFNTPGAPESAVMTIDGFALSKLGLARKGLLGALWAGLIGGLIGVAFLVFLAPWLAAEALNFGPPEFTALAVLGLTVMASLGRGSAVKGFLAGFFGMFISMIGLDPINGTPRMTLGLGDMIGGVPLIPALIGLFAVSESLRLLLADERKGAVRLANQQRVGFTMSDFVSTLRYVVVGSLVGVFVGVKPGGGATIASWLAYSAARAIAPQKDRQKFGSGALGGLLAPEAADKATVGAALIPLLSLGIPASASGAVILGAFQLHDMIPGPLLFTNQPDLIRDLFLALVLANIAVFAVGRGMIEVLIRVRSLDTGVLGIVILIMSTLGAYAFGGSPWDVLIACLLGAVGYAFQLSGIPLAPVVLGMVIGPLFEINFRRSLLLSHDSFLIFVNRPVSCWLFVLSISLFLIPTVFRFISSRKVR